MQQLQQPEPRERVASLNQVANQKLCDSQLVRFRCMVQGMLDPEFYLVVYRVKPLANYSVAKRTGRLEAGDGAKYCDRSEVTEGPSGAALIPPPSLVPRLHVLHHCVLPHTNPVSYRPPSPARRPR